MASDTVGSRDPKTILAYTATIRDMAHILPLGWRHLILLGRYEFIPAEARPLSRLRSLRGH